MFKFIFRFSVFYDVNLLLFHLFLFLLFNDIIYLLFAFLHHSLSLSVTFFRSMVIVTMKWMKNVTLATSGLTRILSWSGLWSGFDIVQMHIVASRHEHWQTNRSSETIVVQNFSLVNSCVYLRPQRTAYELQCICWMDYQWLRLFQQYFFLVFSSRYKRLYLFISWNCSALALMKIKCCSSQRCVHNFIFEEKKLIYTRNSIRHEK